MTTDESRVFSAVRTFPAAASITGWSVPWAREQPALPFRSSGGMASSGRSRTNLNHGFPRVLQCRQGWRPSSTVLLARDDCFAKRHDRKSQIRGLEIVEEPPSSAISAPVSGRCRLRLTALPCASEESAWHPRGNRLKTEEAIVVSIWKRALWTRCAKGWKPDSRRLILNCLAAMDKAARGPCFIQKVTCSKRGMKIIDAGRMATN